MEEEGLEPSKESLISQLKEAAQLIGYHSTLLGRPEEIGDAIVLSKAYSLCRKFAAHEFLIEIIRPCVDEGQRAAAAELERLRTEKEKIQKKQEKLTRTERELAAEEQRLKQAGREFEQWKAEEQRKQEEQAAKAGHALAVTEGRLKLLKGELEAKEKRLGLVSCIEKEQERLAAEQRRLEQEKHGRQSWRQQEKARLEAEMEAELGRRREALERERKASLSQLDGFAAQLAEREARFKRQRLGRFLLKLSGAAACLLLVLPTSQDVLDSYLTARKELAKAELVLRGREKKLADMDSRLRAEGESLGRRQQAVDEAQAELNRREEYVAAAQAEMQEKAGALSRLESELNARKETLLGMQRGLEQRQRSPEQNPSAEQAAWRRAEENLLTVTLVNREPECVSADVVFGGVPFKVSGLGSVKLSVKKGRYSYSVTSLTRIPNAAGLLRWSGSGQIDVFRDGQRFSIVGQYPNLWLASD